MSGGWRFAARLARRDLNRSLRGLRLLFLCIFLGVATLAAIGSLTAAITGELSSRGQVILGGDVQVGMSQRQATAEERAAMAEAGTVSETIRLRSMARSAAGGAVLAELKAVDGLYPLFGDLRVGSGRVRAPPPTRYSSPPSWPSACRFATGERLRFGNAEFRIAGIIAEEPDRVGEGFTLGPVALVSMEGLRRTGLVQPGSLYDTRYRLRLPASAEPERSGRDAQGAIPGVQLGASRPRPGGTGREPLLRPHGTVPDAGRPRRIGHCRDRGEQRRRLLSCGRSRTASRRSRCSARRPATSGASIWCRSAS